MKKVIFVAIIVSSIVAWSVWDHYKYSEPPPGWVIVVNGDGRFAPKHEASGYVIKSDYGSSKVGMSYQSAINRAWGQYKFEQEPKRKELEINWNELPKKGH